MAAELGAIKGYNDGIKTCLEVGDGGSRELIEDNLEDEEEHLDWLRRSWTRSPRWAAELLAGAGGLGHAAWDGWRLRAPVPLLPAPARRGKPISMHKSTQWQQ